MKLTDQIEYSETYLKGKVVYIGTEELGEICCVIHDAYDDILHVTILLPAYLMTDIHVNTINKFVMFEKHL